MLKEILIAGALVAAASSALAHDRPGPGDLLEKADANKDGMIVRDEFLAARAERFTRMDGNSDGFVDSADHPEHKAQARHGERVAKMHARMDADGDGKLSKDEFVNAATPLFDRVDADHNSVLDAQELEAAKAKGKRMRLQRPDRAATQP